MRSADHRIAQARQAKGPLALDRQRSQDLGQVLAGAGASLAVAMAFGAVIGHVVNVDVPNEIADPPTGSRPVSEASSLVLPSPQDDREMNIGKRP